MACYQEGAIWRLLSTRFLNADESVVRELATPRAQLGVVQHGGQSQGYDEGKTAAEIAVKLWEFLQHLFTVLLEEG